MAGVSTTVTRALNVLLDPTQDGSLASLQDDCATLMAEIETTAKEVGGDPEKSVRYLTAREIRSKIVDLKLLASGNYTFHLETKSA